MKTRILLTTIAVLTIGFAGGAFALTAEVTFKSEAQVQPGADVHISDVADVQAPDEFAAKISDVIVTKAPMAGQSRTLQSSYIKQKICMAVPNTTINALGSSQVQISGACSKITGQELADAALAYAQQNLPNDGREYEVTIDQITRDVVTPTDAETTINPEIVSSNLHPGLNPMRITVKAGSRVIATTFASVRVKATASVLIASDRIEAGAPITAQNTVWESRDITRTAYAIVDKGNGQFADLVAKRTIQPGSVIQSNDVSTPLAVKKGESISLVVKSGKVVLQTIAEARQDGSIGDTIRLMTPVSSCEIKAKVVALGQAELKM